MRFKGKKFSEIILEQGQDPTGWEFEYEGKSDPIKGKLIGYNKSGEPEYELPGITKTAKAEKRKISFEISDSGEVTDVKFGI